MEEDLRVFLGSRQIPNEDIMRMQRDKVDKAVLSIMTDEQMAKYLPSYGDRVATLSFCRQINSTSTDKDILLQRLREKIGTRKVKSKAKGALTGTQNAQQIQKGMIRPGNSSGEKTSRKIEVGWLHFINNEYHQVRTRNGGGTRHTSVDKTTTVAEILEMGKRLFFPNGNSTKGPAEDFTFTICDFTRNPIALEDTVGHMYEQTKLKILRFYLCSKELTDELSSEVDDYEDSFSEVISVGIRKEAGSHTDVDDPFDLRYSSDSDNGVQIMNFPEQLISKKQRATETVAAQGPERVHHPRSTPTHTGHGQETYSSAHDEHHNVSPVISETIDLTNLSKGSSQLQHNYHSPEISEDVLGMDDTLEWDPEDRTSSDGYDTDTVVTLNFVQGEDVTQGPRLSGLPLQGLIFQLCSTDDPHTLQSQSIQEKSIQNVQEDKGQLPVQHNLASHSRSQLSPSTTADNSAHPENSHLSVRRVKVVDDLLAAFMDSKIMNINLKMDFVNERALDDAGVSREIYTAFWEQFLEYCEGENERVPRLRPDFGDGEWQAVGRIWIKGLLDHGVIPVRLSKAFILACIHGVDYVEQDILMSSFLNYLPLVERSAVEGALQGTIDESNKEDLMDLFTRMGSHSLPPKINFKTAIETMAHKAILQEPKYVIDCFAIPMAQVQEKLSDKTSVLSLYESKQPTGKRVVQLLETTNVMLSRQEQTTFSHLQRYIKSADQTKAGKILRFCTGSSVICVDKIKVSFNVETGLNRRPIGHTCGATLEVPCTYNSYPEFRTEFDNILSSDYFEMDIL